MGGDLIYFIDYLHIHSLSYFFYWGDGVRPYFGGCVLWEGRSVGRRVKRCDIYYYFWGPGRVTFTHTAHAINYCALLGFAGGGGPPHDLIEKMRTR